MEAATTDIALGRVGDAAVVDDPHLSKKHRDEAAKWYLVSDLLTQAGEGLSYGLAAQARLITHGTRLHADIRSFAETVVRFTITGVSSQVTLKLNPDRDVVYHPTPVDTGVERSAPQLADLQSAEIAQLPPRGAGSNWVDDLLAARGPSASTTMRRSTVRPRRPIMEHASAPAIPLAIPPTIEAETGPVRQLALQRWGPEQTLGENLECGARALHQSLNNLLAVDEEHGPLLDTVRVALRDVMDEDQLELTGLAEVPIGNDNFTVDQLCEGLRQLGDYRLGVIQEEEGQARLWVHGGGDGQIVFVHHQGGHWSSIGPRGSRTYIPMGRRVSAASSKNGRDEKTDKAPKQNDKTTKNKK